MKSKRLGKVITVTMFALMLVFGSGTMLVTSVQAQDRGRNNWDRDRDGRRDRDRNWDRRRNDRNDRNWRRDNDRRRDWDRRRSRNNYPYRPGYSYPRQAPYYGGGGYRGGFNAFQIADQQGYRDGLDRGRDDARSRRSYDLYRSSRFRDADRGYRSSYGSKDAYRNAYRNGFRRGYDQAYRQYAGYRRW